ncbi:MAG: response regulator [Burkholderiales bacterium]|nr:MAG: response regulator [Burkholderiales bacterium]
MHSTFALFHRSGSTVFVDDDIDYLEMLGMVLPGHWQVELYAHPGKFLERMKDEPARWEADAALQLQMIDRGRQGQAMAPQILRYWARNSGRYELIKTCVIDYAMPGIHGLQVLDALLDWPGSRVLLTGQADDQVAIGAFNRGLIDQYIPKHASNIGVQLNSKLRALHQAAHTRLNGMWRATLSSDQYAWLQLPSVADSLRERSDRLWVEHVVLADPFGLLAMDAQGGCHWLQLEPADRLGELAELAATAGLGPSTCRDIESGRKLAAIELHQQLGLSGPVPLAPPFAVDPEGRLLGAHFALPASDLPLPVPSYRHFLDTCRQRRIQGA